MMLLTILLCTTIPVALGIQYQDLEDLKVTCPGRDICGSMFPNATQDFRLRNCECGNICSVYGDCCMDVTTPRRYNNRVLKCLGFGTESYIGAYMMVGCPTNADPTYAAICKAGMNISDPFVSVPVTIKRTTYPNAYCAACNDAPLENLTRWDLMVVCKELESYNVSSAYIWNNLQKDDNGWFVEYEGSSCDVRFVFQPPTKEAIKVRLCRRGEGETEDSGLVIHSELVSECPDVNHRYSDACSSYTAVVYVRNTAYRNPHCAFCNGETKGNMSCDSSEWINPRREGFTFAHLFDVTGSGDVGTVAGDCTSQERYDPVSKRCRPLVCGIPGFVLDADGKCQKNR